MRKSAPSPTSYGTGQRRDAYRRRLRRICRPVVRFNYRTWTDSRFVGFRRVAGPFRPSERVFQGNTTQVIEESWESVVVGPMSGEHHDTLRDALDAFTTGVNDRDAARIDSALTRIFTTLDVAGPNLKAGLDWAVRFCRDVRDLICHPNSPVTGDARARLLAMATATETVLHQRLTDLGDNAISGEPPAEVKQAVSNWIESVITRATESCDCPACRSLQEADQPEERTPIASAFLNAFADDGEPFDPSARPADMDDTEWAIQQIINHLDNITAIIPTKLYGDKIGEIALQTTRTMIDIAEANGETETYASGIAQIREAISRLEAAVELSRSRQPK